MRKFTVILISFIALLGILAFEVFRSQSPSGANNFELKLTSKEYMLLRVSSELDAINSSLPLRIDAHTVLNKVAVEGGALINSYSLDSSSINNFNIEFINHILIPKLVREVCIDTTKRELLLNGIEISMDYYDLSQILIFGFTVTNENCDQ